MGVPWDDPGGLFLGASILAIAEDLRAVLVAIILGCDLPQCGATVTGFHERKVL